MRKDISPQSPENPASEAMDRDTDGSEGDVPKGAGKGLAPSGILRADLGKLRRLSMDIKTLSQVEPASPQPSVDRLSVTFADGSLRMDASSPRTVEKVRFPSQHTDEENSEEEEYSASVTAIMQRRASTRRSKRRSGRRGSSPFSPDILPETDNGRRRSSVFTTSSGDTAITMEDSFTPSVTQEQIFENIKLHKEVLSSVKMQPWNMRKKLRLVAQAKSYIKRHEGALQERLAQSHSTKDMLARCNIYLIKKWHQMKREAANLSNWLIPWELRIKEIESHFGSVVASYFIFLRWLFWVNIVIAIILVAFVAVPEMLTADFSKDPERKTSLPEDRYNATNFLTLWDFEGVFKYSPMFYGWYTNKDVNAKGFRLPLAYFFTGLAVYVYSFVATLRKMAKNSRMSKMSEKEDECIFSWKLFTGWDYMIGNAETAHNRVASIVMSFKEALLEEAEKKREAQSWKLIGSRILVNTGVLSLLALSAFAVVKVVDRSNQKEASGSTWRRNEITVVMSLISLFFPILFELLGYFEHYHPRKQLRLQLARIMVLNLLNLYSLIFALFGKISNMTNHLQSYKPNSTLNPLDLDSSLPTLATTPSEVNTTNCYTVCDQEELTNLIGAAATNLTQVVLPGIMGTSETPLSTASDLAEHLTTHLLQNLTRAVRHVGNTITNNASSVPIAVEDVFKVDLTSFKDTLKEFLEDITDDEKWDDVTETQPFTTTASYEAISEIVTLFDETTTSSPKSDVTCRLHCDPVSTPRSIVDRTAYRFRNRLRSLCWETMFGQELMKLTVMDLVMTVLSTLAIDFLRGLFVRYVNGRWCWDLEKRFPQYGDFKVAENILHLVNNQGMVWMGMFFSPGLVVLNVLKLYVMMYLRSWAVLTCNVPHEVIFRASRSNNFYFALLLMMLFLCVLPVGYTVVWLEPSWHCGPFSIYHRIFHIFTKTIRKALPTSFHNILDYIASPGIVIPLLVLLILIIYYLISLSNALREANNDLKIQLRRERTEERRKMFQIADRRRRGGSAGSGDMNPFGKWKKLLQGMPGGKSFEDTPRESAEVTPVEKEKPEVGKKILSKFIFRALKARKPSVSEDDDSVQPQDDGTDTEQHESLPDDASLKETRNSTKKRPTRLESGDSSERRVKIHDRIASYHKRRDTIESRRSPFSESRKDSVNSNWSDNIPVITISKTESSECILETKTQLEAVAEKLLKNGNETSSDPDPTEESHLHKRKKEQSLQRSLSAEELKEGVKRSDEKLRVGISDPKIVGQYKSESPTSKSFDDIIYEESSKSVASKIMKSSSLPYPRFEEPGLLGTSKTYIHEVIGIKKHPESSTSKKLGEADPFRSTKIRDLSSTQKSREPSAKTRAQKFAASKTSKTLSKFTETSKKTTPLNGGENVGATTISKTLPHSSYTPKVEEPVPKSGLQRFFVSKSSKIPPELSPIPKFEEPVPLNSEQNIGTNKTSKALSQSSLASNFDASVSKSGVQKLGISEISKIPSESSLTPKFEESDQLGNTQKCDSSTSSKTPSKFSSIPESTPIPKCEKSNLINATKIFAQKITTLLPESPTEIKERVPLIDSKIQTKKSVPLTFDTSQETILPSLESTGSLSFDQQIVDSTTLGAPSESSPMFVNPESPNGHKKHAKKCSISDPKCKAIDIPEESHFEVTEEKNQSESAEEANTIRYSVTENLHHSGNVHNKDFQVNSRKFEGGDQGVASSTLQETQSNVQKSRPINFSKNENGKLEILKSTELHVLSTDFEFEQLPETSKSVSDNVDYAISKDYISKCSDALKLSKIQFSGLKAEFPSQKFVEDEKFKPTVKYVLKKQVSIIEGRAGIELEDNFTLDRSIVDRKKYFTKTAVDEAIEDIGDSAKNFHKSSKSEEELDVKIVNAFDAHSPQFEAHVSDDLNDEFIQRRNSMQLENLINTPNQSSKLFSNDRLNNSNVFSEVVADSKSTEKIDEQGIVLDQHTLEKVENCFCVDEANVDEHSLEFKENLIASNLEESLGNEDNVLFVEKRNVTRELEEKLGNKEEISSIIIDDTVDLVGYQKDDVSNFGHHIRSESADSTTSKCKPNDYLTLKLADSSTGKFQTFAQEAISTNPSTSCDVSIHKSTDFFPSKTTDLSAPKIKNKDLPARKSTSCFPKSFISKVIDFPASKIKNYDLPHHKSTDFLTQKTFNFSSHLPTSRINVSDSSIYKPIVASVVQASNVVVFGSLIAGDDEERSVQEEEMNAVPSEICRSLTDQEDQKILMMSDKKSTDTTTECSDDYKEGTLSFGD